MKFLTQPPSVTIMTNRFDLEQAIMSCWNIVDDLEYLKELVQDNDSAMNIVIALKELYAVKFSKLQEVFENCIANRKI